jgi:hypothetical protein
MVCFQTKNPNLGEIWMALEWKMLVYFLYILLIYGHLEYFMVIWYILWPFVNAVVIWYISLVLVYCVKKNMVTPV